MERLLRERIDGEVRFDERALALYSTDASPYRIKPVGVVVPLDDDDVRAAVEVARDRGVPLLARGGGTSLAGQTVGEALVLDFSKMMTAILELNVAERWVRVQPGLVCDQLNAELAPHRLHFSPDVSTSNRANVGGMVANNSAGTRSIKYGKSVDQVIGLRVLLMDGTELELGPLDAEQLSAKLELPGREGDLYRGVKKLIDEHASEIEARYPKVLRRVGGYNLDELLGAPTHRPFNLAKLVAGSEGTLAVILELKLALQPLPGHRALTVLQFASSQDAFTAVQLINRHKPSAVEMIDRELIALGRGGGTSGPGGVGGANQLKLAWLVDDPAAVLIVEFEGDDEVQCHQQIEGLRADAALAHLAYSVEAVSSDLQYRELRKLRRDGLGIYNTVPGRAKPTAFIEDAAIPVENLAAYIKEIKELCELHGVDTVFYGHASVGVIHTRPLLDLKTEAGVETYRAISEGAFELVLKYGGSWSGEHGDGLIRSYQNRRMFGDSLYEAFEAIKTLFDPAWLMNPGKIVSAPPMTDNLRFGASYPQVEVETTFDFSAQGGFLGAVEACVGVGDCRKVGSGAMCPSYMGTRDEEHSTRGRANVLREALTGGIPGGLTSRDVYQVLDLCLECKACKAECPSSVDMAKLKYEWLQHYHDQHGTPLATRALGNVAKVAPLAQALAPLSNALLASKPVHWLLEKVVGVDSRRQLPRYAPQRFDSWFARHKRSRGADHAETSAAVSNGPVALFADSWTMFNHVELGQAAVAVLEHLGYEVELVTYGCCGRPQLSKGLVKQAREMARSNVARLDDYVRRGVPVVGLEPSCVAAFSDDYPDLLPGEATLRVAKHVKMLESFLTKEWVKGRIDPKRSFSRSAGEVQFHAHCHQQAVLGSSSSRAVLEWVAEEVAVLDAGCCGMAGSFGYVHHDLSLTIGEQRLFPAVRSFAGVTAATGFSCRHQIVDGTGSTAQHPVEVLARHLKPVNAVSN